MTHKNKSEFVPLQFKPASKEQLKLAGKLEISVENDSWELAKARILDAIGDTIGEPLRNPTSGQFELASELRLNIDADSFRIAFAKIAEHIIKVNIKAVNDQELCPGVLVVGFGGVHEISTITPDGHLYFKGTGSPQGSAGKCARCNDDVLGIMITQLEADPEAQFISVLNCVAALEWTVKNREITLSEKLRLAGLSERLGGLLKVTLQRLGIYPPQLAASGMISL